MLEKIKKCQKCALCINQEPLLDCSKDCQIFWVGLSAKLATVSDEIPLAPHTNTGKLIKKIEDNLENIDTYKTNIVKCVPLNDKNKLRYPNQSEISNCINHLMAEIDELSPKLVFLLGEKVYSSVGKYLKITFNKWNDFEFKYVEHKGVYYIPVHHPSYIHVYRRKQTNEYIDGINYLIKNLIN